MRLLARRHRLAALAVQRDHIRVLIANGSPQTGQVLTFRFDAEPGWTEPEQLGLSFRAFFKQQAISARTVELLALPADWVAVRTLSLPQLKDESILPDLVRTSADDLFAQRAEDLAIGYEAATNDDATRVTVVSLLRSRLTAMQTFLRAAGLKAAAVVPYTAAIARAVGPDDGPGIVVTRNGESVEIAAVHSRRLTWLQGLDNGDDMDVELRRASLTGAIDAGSRVVVLGTNGLASAAGHALGCEPEICEPPDDESLTLLAGAAHCPTLNLLDTHTPARSLRPILTRLGLAALLAVLLTLWAGVQWQDVLNRTEAARAEIRSLRSEAQAAEELREQLRATASWRSTTPESLDTLHDLTELFPQEATIWLRSFKRDDEGSIDIAGWARNRQYVQHLQESLEKSPHFTSIKSGAVRDAAGKNGAVSFSVECRHAEGRTE